MMSRFPLSGGSNGCSKCIGDSSGDGGGHGDVEGCCNDCVEVAVVVVGGGGGTEQLGNGVHGAMAVDGGGGGGNGVFATSMMFSCRPSPQLWRWSMYLYDFKR